MNIPESIDRGTLKEICALLGMDVLYVKSMKITGAEVTIWYYPHPFTGAQHAVKVPVVEAASNA
jgi:hypothetical protein